MRLLIGNDLDDSILHKRDVRAWAQRILWFARDGDAIILMDEPDAEFLRYVTELTGTDLSSLRIYVTPEGRFGRRMMDPESLSDPGFVSQLAAGIAGVESVFALWSSPAVSRLVDQLGVSESWLSSRLYSQNAVELFNSMGNFRAFATAAGVPISNGSVVRTSHDAAAATRRLLNQTDAIMIKKSHGGAGAGNMIVTSNRSLETGHAGSRSVAVLDPSAVDVEAFWAEHWAWASSDGRYPVVIERFVPDALSVYVEFLLDASGIALQEMGELRFRERCLVEEVVPLRSLSEPTRSRLVASASRLAEYYFRLGHRGYLSADAIVTASEFAFTEVNAQVTGSTHLYGVIAHDIVDVWRDPQRTVTQCTSSGDWRPLDVAQFLAAAEKAGCLYDPDGRRGVLPVTPHIGGGGGGPLVMAVVHESPEEFLEIVSALASVLQAGSLRSR